MGNAGGRFYGWVMGAGLPAALAADWLTGTWDQNAGIYACGPAAAVVEEVCGAWLKDVLGLPAAASFSLVTGCQMAHVTCLAAARHAVLARPDGTSTATGLPGRRVRVLTSDEVHGTTTRAASSWASAPQTSCPTDRPGRATHGGNFAAELSPGAAPAHDRGAAGW